jgi:ABC-type uncharacterized transport system substrate-binding protein
MAAYTRPKPGLAAMRYLAAFLTLLSMLFAGPASPHPHVFVDTKIGFRTDQNGQLTGLFVSWTYDPLTTLFLFEALNLDSDNDGRFTDDDYAAIVRGETEWPEGYVGDLYLEVDGQVYPHLNPTNATAGYENEQISVAFDLPLSKPLALAGQEVALRNYDPSYYYAYAVLEIVDVSPLPATCDTSLNVFEPDAAADQLLATLGRLSREETPEDENIGRLFSDLVVLSCD